MVAFAGGEGGGGDFFEKSGDLLIGYVRLPIEYKNRYVNFSKFFGVHGRRDCTANDGRQDLWVSSRHASRYEVRRGEVSGNDFALLQDSCPLLRSHPNSQRTRYVVRNRPTFWKF